MRCIILLGAFIAQPVAAQVFNPPAPILPPNVATKADVATAIVQATPDDCPKPASDTLTGSAGTAARCMPRQDATRATQVQRVRTTTAADGTWSVTWPVAFPVIPDIVWAFPYGASQPHTCQPITVSVTGATGKCFQIISSTLPGVLTSLPGVVISPFTNPSAGMTVMVGARQ